MATIQIITLSLLVAGVLIALGFYFQRRALFLSMGGSVILAVVGIIMLGDGVSFVTGLNETIVDNVTTITTDVFTQQNNTATLINAWVITLLGFAGVIGSVLGLNKLRFEEDELDDKFEGKF